MRHLLVQLFRGLPTAVGAATGAVVGLVGITPSAGFVSPMSAIFIGFYTVLSVFFMPRLMRRFALVDDRLDCFIVVSIMRGGRGRPRPPFSSLPPPLAVSPHSV